MTSKSFQAELNSILKDVSWISSMAVLKVNNGEITEKEATEKTKAIVEEAQARITQLVEDKVIGIPDQNIRVIKDIKQKQRRILKGEG